MPQVVAVAAIGRNRELGEGDKLLWTIPDDLKRFKELTEGHPIILGRKTFESIVNYIGKPLPRRTNIVVTRDPDYSLGLMERNLEDVLVAPSIDVALRQAGKLDDKQISIGGGAQIYKLALPFTDKLCLTLVDAENPHADAFFPEYEKEFTKKSFEKSNEFNGLKYTWVDLERI